MQPIENKNVGYILTRNYVQFAFKKFYGEYIVKGIENLPENKPIIFAPNHLNALMDALAVATLPPHQKTKVFLARADVFNKSLVAKFLRFVKILPAFRIRDGFENLEKNAATFNEAVAALSNNACLCIMPEGNQGSERNIRPLVKGIFRIAFKTQEALGESHPVQIVPVGIDMGDFVKSKKHIIIEIGKPIDVLSYFSEFNENQAGTINKIRSRLKSDLENLIVHIPTGDNYKSIERIILQQEDLFLEKSNLENNTYNRFLARKSAVHFLQKLIIEENDQYNKLVNLTQKLSEIFEKHKLRAVNFNKKSPEFPWKTGILNILLMPILIVCSILNFLPEYIPVKIRKSMHVEFTGFWSSIHFVLGLFTFPVFYLLQSILLGLAFNTGLWGMFAFVILHFYAGKVNYFLYAYFKKWIANLKVWQMYQNDKTTFDFIITSMDSVRNTILKS